MLKNITGIQCPILVRMVISGGSINSTISLCYVNHLNRYKELFIGWISELNPKTIVIGYGVGRPQKTTGMIMLLKAG